jgi:plastocyanin
LKLRLLLTTALAVALLSPIAINAATTSATLVGTTGPGFTITLTMNGRTVKKLKAGKYKLVIRDKSAIHNFHLIGPGVSKVATTVPFVGTKTMIVTLKKGKYTFQCDIHVAAGMKGTFLVT